MTSTSSSTSSTTPASALALGTSTATTPTRRRIVVDASKLRHGAAVDAEGSAHHAALIYADSDCGCIVGVVLAACGVPADDMVGDAIYYGECWPDFLPAAWHDTWMSGSPYTPFSQITEAFDRGFEPTAAHKLIEMFESAGVELVFENFPDEVQVFDPETDRRASPEEASRERGTPIVDRNMRADPMYAPYCTRCTGMVRMRRTSATRAEHHCGAIHELPEHGVTS